MPSFLSLFSFDLFFLIFLFSRQLWHTTFPSLMHFLCIKFIVSIMHSDPDSDINYRLEMTTDGSTELPGKRDQRPRRGSHLSDTWALPCSWTLKRCSEGKIKTEALKIWTVGYVNLWWDARFSRGGSKRSLRLETPQNFRVQTRIPSRELQLNLTHKTRSTQQNL